MFFEFLGREHPKQKEQQVKRLWVGDELGMFIGRKKRMEGNEALAKNRLGAVERWVGISPSTHTRCISPALLFPIQLHWSLLWNKCGDPHKVRITRQVASVQNLVSPCSCLAMPSLSCGSGVTKNCQRSVACKRMTGKLS